MLGNLSGGGMIDYQQVETLRQLLNRIIGELLQRTNLPPDIDVRMQLHETLGCRYHRQISARMPPGDARQLYGSLQESILFVKHCSVNERAVPLLLRRGSAILKAETQ